MSKNRRLLMTLSSCDECPWMRDVDPYPLGCNHPEGPKYAEFRECPLEEIEDLKIPQETKMPKEEATENNE